MIIAISQIPSFDRWDFKYSPLKYPLKFALNDGCAYMAMRHKRDADAKKFIRRSCLYINWNTIKSRVPFATKKDWFTIDSIETSSNCFQSNNNRSVCWSETLFLCAIFFFYQFELHWIAERWCWFSQRKPLSISIKIFYHMTGRYNWPQTCFSP